MKIPKITSNCIPYKDPTENQTIRMKVILANKIGAYPEVNFGRFPIFVLAVFLHWQLPLKAL